MNVDILQKSRWEDTQLEGVVLRLIIMSPFKEPSNQIPSITYKPTEESCSCLGKVALPKDTRQIFQLIRRKSLEEDKLALSSNHGFHWCLPLHQYARYLVWSS